MLEAISQNLRDESDHLPPILNAVEIFLLIGLPDSQSNSHDGNDLLLCCEVTYFGLKISSNMVDRQPSFLVLQLCLVLVSVIITVRNSKLAGAYGEHAKRKLQYQADSSGKF
ncbi:hypothetical protein EZV62_003646 [Acer yangbiense]|uniref:Uncharacterized protein n=1 Tax=Acer yangbiense TaxID=1000413 RepID=A0A5C7IHV5_9ROSI|nr:hypothetical protein EZV62_003646 [Acer yangbiense]